MQRNTRKTTEEFKNEVYNLTENEYSVIGGYVTKETPIKMIHNKCSTIFCMRPGNFLHGSRCPECAKILRQKNKKITLSKFLDIFEKNNTELFKYIDILEFNGMKEKTKVYNKKTNEIYYIAPIYLINGNGTNKRLTNETFSSRLHLKNKNIELIGKYKRKNTI